MPKYRQLHTKIIDSFDFNEMPDDFTRVVWLMLPLILDCEGRGIGNMVWVKSKLFPLREDVTTIQLQAAFDWFANKKSEPDGPGMIVFYQVDGHSYFYIPTFKTYQSGTQKEARSMLPAPPELLQSNSGVDKEQINAVESDFVSESLIVSESLSLKIQKPKTIIPRDGDIGRVYAETTGMVSMPACDKRGDYIDAIYQMLLSYGYDATLVRMKSAYNAWKAQHTKDGRQYSKTNLAWINYAVAGEVPGGNGSITKSKSVAEEIAEELSHDRPTIRH